MGLKQITPPPVEPLVLAQCYRQCQIDLTGSPATSVFDAWLTEKIAVVRQQVEFELSRALVQQTWELWLDDFPRPLLDDLAIQGGAYVGGYYGATGYVQRYNKKQDWRAIHIPKPPLQSITSVKYLDQDGALQTLDPATYVLDDSVEPAEIAPVPNTFWPQTTPQAGAVKIRFVCGYATSGSPPNYRANLPPIALHWMLLMLSTWFRNREESLQGIVIQTLPQVEQMLFPLKVLSRNV